MTYNYLAIEGIIGAGKTSLAKKLAADFNGKEILEQFKENPFLPKFYSDPEKYSFILEMSFLADRYQQLKNDLNNRDLFKPMIISDYYFSKSLIFAKSTLGQDEFKLYRNFFNIIYKSLPKPDLYIYLHTSVEKALENIRKRGRDYEQNISKEYLIKIQDSYFEYFKQQTNIRFLLIESSGIDFVNKPDDYKKLTDIIFNKEYKIGLNRITA